MTLAYLISAHTDPLQLARLVQALDDDAHFFVHVDKKTDIRAFQQLCPQPNVHFLEQRFDVRWATYLQVDYQLALLRAAVAYPLHFHRLIMLSGLDYPIRSNAEIRAWIEAQGKRETLWTYCLDTPLLPESQRRLYSVPRLLLRRFPTKYATWISILCRRAMERFNYRRPLHLDVDGKQWPVYKGSSWFCISEALAGHILSTYDAHPTIHRFFEHTFGPDETMIPTIVMNSPQWATHCTLCEGEYPGLAALTPIHFIIYEPEIRVMKMEHLDLLRQSKKLFARKFVSGQSDELIDTLRATNEKS